MLRPRLQPHFGICWAGLQPPTATVAPAALEHLGDSDEELEDADTSISDAEFALALASQAKPVPSGLGGAHAGCRTGGDLAC